MRLDEFILFNPANGSLQEIPTGAGNYFVVLREGCHLPATEFSLQIAQFRGMNIIYTGVAGPSSGLRRRITRAHLGNNAGRSTLRLSLGVLMGFTLVPRDIGKPNNGHVRFCSEDEKELTAWMKGNMLFYFLPNDGYETMEDELIATLNPPLNLSKNANPVNKEFRALLSELRSNVQVPESQIRRHDTDEPFEVKRKPRKCPCCGGKVVPIIYGYPSPDARDAAMRGEIVLGGCVVDIGDPDWMCVDCGASFRKNMILELE